MADTPREKLRILLCNDDGVHAPGLKVLERIARKLTDDVWICAPEHEQSAASHSLTIARPLRLKKLDEQRYCVDGTPTDCALFGINHIMKNNPPSLVLSGVNYGDNLGEDLGYSGTVAAATEAALIGPPAIALSAQTDANGSAEAAFEVAEAHAPKLIHNLLDLGWPPDCLISINFPACKPDEVTGVRVVRQAAGIAGVTPLLERQDIRNRSYFWIGDKDFDPRATSQPDSDVAAVAERAISVTPITLDLTHREMLLHLKETLPTHV